jgi:[acyl-carrier-protein] S-malonyltransferase
MNCFMYPGQPLAFAGPLLDDPDFSEIAALTLRRTGLDLGAYAWTDREWTENIKLQVYGVAMSLYGTRRLRREEVVPGLIAEHSLGIYPALAACAALSEEDAVELAFRVGCVMSEMGRGRDFAIGCVVGLTLEPLLAVAENNSVYLANHNTSRHFLLSGERGGMEAAMAEALQAGAFSARTFPCDAPLHTPLLAEAADELQAVFRDYRYREPVVPLVNHIDQDFLTAADMADFMLREMLQPVYWEKTYHVLKRAGAGRFYEAGVGDALKKYNRWIESEF